MINISKLHHVGIIVPNEIALQGIFRSLGYIEAYRGFVNEFSCMCVFVELQDGIFLEYIIPEKGSALSTFNQGAGGIHHYAEKVDDLLSKMVELEQKGLKFLLPKPIKGAGDFICNFLPPQETNGPLIEFVQAVDPSSSD